MSRLALSLVLALALFGCKNRTNRPSDTLTCTPGEGITIGCDGAVGSVCGGDPVIDACDGTIAPAACDDTSAYAVNDDAAPGNNCPHLVTTCPTSGRVTVGVHGFGGAAFDCYWDIQHGGATSDAGLGGGG